MTRHRRHNQRPGPLSRKRPVLRPRRRLVAAVCGEGHDRLGGMDFAGDTRLGLVTMTDEKEKTACLSAKSAGADPAREGPARSAARRPPLKERVAAGPAGRAAPPVRGRPSRKAERSLSEENHQDLGRRRKARRRGCPTHSQSRYRLWLCCLSVFANGARCVIVHLLLERGKLSRIEVCTFSSSHAKQHNQTAAFVLAYKWCWSTMELPYHQKRSMRL
jgi:hypothetical protein